MAVDESTASPGIGRICGALGCTDDAEVVINHPEHGERVVCKDDINGHEVVRDV